MLFIGYIEFFIATQERAFQIFPGMLFAVIQGTMY